MAAEVTPGLGFRARASRRRTGSQQQNAVTPSQELLLAAAPLASPMPGPLGRLGRALPPAPLYGSDAAGNAAVISDARGQAAAFPGAGAGDGIADASPYPHRNIVTPPSQLNLTARTPQYQHGRLIARDRRVIGRRGTVMLSGQRDTKPGFPDPDADGPARPAYEQFNRTISKQVGTDATAGLDNAAAKPMTSAGGQPFSLGTRGDPQTRRYGGTPGLAAFRPYGHRGFPRGTAAPAPRLVALAGGPLRRGTLIDAGDPGDGPQKFPSGPPWGLHSDTVPPAKLTGAVISDRFGQVRPVRQNRPLNSRAQGQSYDQRVVHQDGTVAAIVPRMNPGRQPGLQFRRTR